MSKRPLRVAITSETFIPKVDGVVTVLCLLLDYLREIGAEAIVFSAGQHVESYQGFPVVSITPSLPLPIYPEIKIPLTFKNAFRILREFDPDIVHLAHPMLTGVPFIHFARRLDTPVVISFHAHLMDMAAYYGFKFVQWPLWQIHRFVFRQADYRLATSIRIQSEMIGHGFGPTGLWRRGVDPALFSPAHRDDAMRHDLLKGDLDKILLIFVGRLAPEKQIEQIRYVLEALPNTHLAIVGDGPHRPKLEKVFEGMPVTFAGYLRGRDLSAAYNAADIFVFPSATETFGLVVAEAMATGLPVVSSRVGGISEIITSGTNGFIFEPGDIDRMVAHVQTLADDADRRRQMGRAALESIQHLTWPVIMNELVDDYWRIVDEYHRTD